MRCIALATTALCTVALLCGLSSRAYSQTRLHAFARSELKVAVNRGVQQKVRPRTRSKRFPSSIKLGVISGKASRSKVLHMLKLNAATKSLNVVSTPTVRLSSRKPYVSRGQLNVTGQLNTNSDYIRSETFKITALGNAKNLFLVDMFVHVRRSDVSVSFIGVGKPSPGFSLSRGDNHVVFVVKPKVLRSKEVGVNFSANFTHTVRLRSVEITQLAQ